MRKQIKIIVVAIFITFICSVGYSANLDTGLVYSVTCDSGPFESIELYKSYGSGMTSWGFDLGYGAVSLDNSKIEIVIDERSFYLNNISILVDNTYASGEDVETAILAAESIAIKAYNVVGRLYEWTVNSEVINEWQDFLTMELCNPKEYASSYELIQWGCRYGDYASNLFGIKSKPQKNDIFYSFDLFYEDWSLAAPALVAGDHLHSVDPSSLNLEPGIYHWKVWSESVEDYDTYQDGFEGEFTVPEGAQAENRYQSTYEMVEWDNRGDDTYYCIDICDQNWNIFEGFQVLECGENFHSWSPKQFLNDLGIYEGSITGFTFNWRVWSPGGYGGDGFEGTVICK